MRISFLFLTLAFAFKGSSGSLLLSELFPYGPSNGDLTVPTADDNFITYNFTLGREFNFFQHSYTSIFVNNNGGVSFVRGVPSYTPNCDPQTTPMIIPYWADVDTYKGGKVYYRETADPTLLQMAKRNVNRAFPLLNVNPTWLFIATWSDVAFFVGTANCSANRTVDPRNDFQTVLVTEGSKSFVMFGYNKTMWTTGMASGGDCMGRGGTPAKAGFDVGDGSTFYTLPGSCTAEIGSVQDTSNTGVSGEYIFRVDQGLDAPVPVPEAINSTTVEPPLSDNFTMTTTSTLEPVVSPTEVPVTSTPLPERNCDPNDCTLVGYCKDYSACNPMTSLMQRWQCSEGLFWNPHNLVSANSTEMSTLPPSACHGNCDVWDNLPASLKQQYLADTTCSPGCYYAAVGPCENRYIYHGHGKGMETVNCPIDTREGMHVPLVWVQERETCDFCYNTVGVNAMGVTNLCCDKYDWHLNHVNGTEMLPVPVMGPGRVLIARPDHGFDLKKKL